MDNFTNEVNNPDIYIYKTKTKNKEQCSDIKIAFRKNISSKKITECSKDLARAYSKYPKMRIILTLYNKKKELKDFIFRSISKNCNILQFDFAKPN